MCLQRERVDREGKNGEENKGKTEGERKGGMKRDERKNACVCREGKREKKKILIVKVFFTSL